MSTALGNEMTCKELVELVTEYLEGTLLAADVVRFNHHLASCDGCQLYLAQMRSTIETLGQLDEGDVEPRALDELLRAFRGWHAGSANASD